MADVDIDPFGGVEHPSRGEHESRPGESMSENIPLIPGVGGSTWEPKRGE